MTLFLRLLVFAALALTVLPEVARAQGESRNFLKLQQEIIYEKPTMEELSRLYWSLGSLDPENDAHIDNYLAINECDIYKEFRNNEFEWRQIRESTRAYLKNNYHTFTRRIEFMQPLYLEEYDFEKNSFKIVPEFVKPVSRRMEVLTSKHMESICGLFGELEGYPKGIIVELTRPFGLEYVPVDREKAQDYINKKLEIFNKLAEHQKTPKRFAESRDAYIWIQVRVFGFKESVRLMEGYVLNNVFAVMEGMEIYADRERRDRIYRKTYDFYSTPSDFEQRLREQYEAMMNNQLADGGELQDENKGLGLLHVAERILKEGKQREEVKGSEEKDKKAE